MSGIGGIGVDIEGVGGDGSEDALRCLLATYEVRERKSGVGSGQWSVCKFNASMNRRIVEVNAVSSRRAGREAKDCWGVRWRACFEVPLILGWEDEVGTGTGVGIRG